MPDMSVWGEGVWGLLQLGGAEYLDVVNVNSEPVSRTH